MTEKVNFRRKMGRAKGKKRKSYTVSTNPRRQLYLLNHPITQLPGQQLPSVGNILRYIQYLKSPRSFEELLGICQTSNWWAEQFGQIWMENSPGWNKTVRVCPRCSTIWITCTQAWCFCKEWLQIFVPIDGFLSGRRS